HSYSPNNVMLVARQHARAFVDGAVLCAEPTYVAGFNTWKALGRAVNKGQHGYAILAPCRYDRRVAVDPEGRTRTLAKTDTPTEGENVEERRVLAGFRVEYVFDGSQTTGVELAEPPRPVLLQGEAPPGLGSAVLALIEDRGFQVDTVPGAGAIEGANGQTDWASRTVVVRADMDDAAMVKTLVHEAAHVLLHEGPPGQYLPRATKEVEAESVAYVVAASHGMASDGYSFPYVAAWAGEDGAKAVVATQARVSKAARQIIEARRRLI
ncbi:MAG: ArdC family protein, partial [Actinomycetota bacterium]|nr:ArdC family protein [Actinomycetota bacterium]